MVIGDDGNAKIHENDETLSVPKSTMRITRMILLILMLTMMMFLMLMLMSMMLMRMMMITNKQTEDKNVEVPTKTMRICRGSNGFSKCMGGSFDNV